MAELIMMRHGESEWNASGRLAGLTDIELTQTGRKQARQMARHYRDIPLHAAYTSELVRTQQTLSEATIALAQPNVAMVTTGELNERDCGIYTGRSKSALRAEIGTKEFARLDHEWSYKPPGGESMAALRDRLIPFFTTVLLPQLRQERNLLVVSSYNPIRILKWHVQALPEESIGLVTSGNAEVCICTFDANGDFVKLMTFEGDAQTE